MIPFVDLHAQRESLGPSLMEAVRKVMERGDYILGTEVAEFESEFARYCETQFCVGVDSGTSAIELALRALNVGPGSEVIVPAHTFIASVLPVLYVGATPVLVDVDPVTMTMDVRKLEAAITPKTRVIIPVHLYGLPADMQRIMALAERAGAFVIEDACQAHGARVSVKHRMRRVGSVGHMGCFSFYPAKNLGGAGDGGAVVTSHPDLDKKLRMLRDYGQTEKYRHEIVGYNRRLDTLQAAILRVKLRRLDEWNQMRRAAASRYDAALEQGGHDWQRGLSCPYANWLDFRYDWSVYHLYVVRHPRRAELAAGLRALGVQTGLHYPVPLHLQPALKHLGHVEGDFPAAERIARTCLSLPMYPELTGTTARDEPGLVEQVCAAVEEVLAKFPLDV
jgi:dTDP-4-amino-4,6-dideoxygalactose transaminase